MIKILKNFYNIYINIKFKRLCTFILVLLLSLAAYYNWISKDFQNKSIYYDDLKDGDLIFRKGTGFFSRFFSSIDSDDNEFSHVGIIKIEDGYVYVLHTEANELTGYGHAIKETVEKFTSPQNSKHAVVYRLKNFDKKIADFAAFNASKFVSKKVPFDSSFDLNTKNKLYCTELVNEAYHLAGQVLIDKPKKISLSVKEKKFELEAITIDQILSNSKIHFVKTIN